MVDFCRLGSDSGEGRALPDLLHPDYSVGSHVHGPVPVVLLSVSRGACWCRLLRKHGRAPAKRWLPRCLRQERGRSLAMLLLDEMEKKPSRGCLLLLVMGHTETRVFSGEFLEEVMDHLAVWVDNTGKQLMSHTATHWSGLWWVTGVCQSH